MEKDKKSMNDFVMLSFDFSEDMTGASHLLEFKDIKVYR